MKYLITLFFSTLILIAQGQENVELNELKDKIGKLVVVKGKISNISTIGKANFRNIVINVGGIPPKEQLSILLEQKVNIETYFLLKEKKFSTALIVVTGKVELFKGKPRIVVKNDDQIRYIIDEEVLVDESFL